MHYGANGSPMVEMSGRQLDRWFWGSRKGDVLVGMTPSDCIDR